MNVNVVQNPNNQISVFTGTGQQLVAGPQASQLQFRQCGNADRDCAMERKSEPGRRRHHHAGIARRRHDRSDRHQRDPVRRKIGAYLQMRDTILPQAQTQLDEFANQMSQALSNQTTNGTAVTSGSQSGFSVDVGSLLPGNSLQVTYTNSGNVQHTITVESLGAGRHAAAADFAVQPQ